MDNEEKFYKLVKAFMVIAEKHNYGDFDYGVDANNADQLLIVTNWNNIPNSDRWEKAFEKLDVEIGWSDEYSRCDECGNLIHTSPTHYGWEPDYILDNNGYICRTCIENNIDNLEEYFTDHIYEYNNGIGYKVNAIPSWATEYFKNEHWECWNEDNESLCNRYESGWHPGQNDDPKKVFKEIMEIDNDLKVIFVINDVGQFDVRWSVFVKLKTDEE